MADKKADLESRLPRESVSLGHRWRAFAHLTLDPWFLVLLGAAGLLCWFSVSQTDKVAKVMANVMAMLATTVLGGRAMQLWASYNEKSAIAARGHGAIRSLNVLLRSVASLQSRLTTFLKPIREQDGADDVTKRNYEEGIRTCIDLQEHVVSSIENWQDVIPEADIRSQIGELTRLHRERHLANEKILALQSEKKAMEKAGEISEKESASFKSQSAQWHKRMSDIEARIAELRAESDLAGAVVLCDESARSYGYGSFPALGWDPFLSSHPATSYRMGSIFGVDRPPADAPPEPAVEDREGDNREEPSQPRGE